MSKLIKVRPKVYDELDQLRGKGETFNEVIQDLIDTRAKLCFFCSDIEGTIKLRTWQQDRVKGKSKE